MSQEHDILAALKTITEFRDVRYILRESQDELQPSSIPMCVFTMEARDYSDFQTFCGVDLGAYTQSFIVQFFAKTTDECSLLAGKVITALSGIGVVSSVETDFEPDLRAFTSVIQFN